MREFIIPEDYIEGGWLELESDYIERECKEVIRCKDCKHHGEQYGNGYCMKDGCYGWYDEDYCSRAVRNLPQVNPEMVKELLDRIEKQRCEK